MWPGAPGWSPVERELIRAVDEMRYEAMISDATWAALRAYYSDQQAMEALYTATQYQLVSMALNSAGVQVYQVLDGSTRMSGGRYRFDFDVSSLPSGDYYCVLEAGRFRAVEQVKIVK